MELLEVSQCIGWCGRQHFNNHFQGFDIILYAFFAIIAYHLWVYAYDKDLLNIKKKVDEEMASKIARLLIMFCTLLLAGFIIYWLFFFKPETLGKWAMQNTGDLIETLRNTSTLDQLRMYS